MAEQAENKSWYQKTWWKITSYILVFLFGVSVGQDEKKAERAEAVVVEKTVVAEKPPTVVAEKPPTVGGRKTPRSRSFSSTPGRPSHTLKLNHLLGYLLGVREIMLLFQMQAKFLKLPLFLLCLRNFLIRFLLLLLR